MTQRILQWLILVAVSFLLFASVALLSGCPAPEAGKEFVYTVVPNYLQAASTIFAAYVAWVVFRQWREPELAKKKAEQAPKLQELLAAYEASLRAARYSHMAFDFPLTEKWLTHALAELRSTRVDKFAKDLQALRAMQQNIIDPAAGKLVDHLLVYGQQFMTAWGYVNDLTIDLVEDTDVDLSKEEYPDYQKYLEKLGFRRRHHRSSNFGEEVEAVARRLRVLLRHHITLSNPDD
jgi:flagellar biosynthesis chaperone FliJ